MMRFLVVGSFAVGLAFWLGYVGSQAALNYAWQEGFQWGQRATWNCVRHSTYWERRCNPNGGTEI